MPEIKSYQPGMYSWADLSTTDVAAAKKFYGEIFGWKAEDMPTPMGPYSMAKLKGKDAAGIAGLDPKQGMPPHWNNYFWVTNIDESAKKAESLGGKILMQPMDAEKAGRMAVIADPSGAAFCLWQQKQHMGAGVVGDHGAICWAELETRNVDACGKFYAKLFNWEPVAQTMPGMKYTVFQAGKDMRAGMMPMNDKAPAQMPSHWTVYFGVDSCDKSAAQIQKAGGKLIVPATDIPEVGRFAMATDPQGAFFAILQPAPRK